MDILPRARMVTHGANRGSIAVEFGLLLPVLLVLLAGTISWGDLLAKEVSLVQIARDAALAGGRTSTTDDPEAVAESRAQEGLAASGFDATRSTITITRVSLPSGLALVVDLEVTMDPPLDLLPVPRTLDVRTTARLDDQ